MYSDSAFAYIHSPKLTPGVNPLVVLISGSREAILMELYLCILFIDLKNVSHVHNVKNDATLIHFHHLAEN